MDWQMIAALTPATGLLGLAVWRFSRLEVAVRHNSECNRTLVKIVGRLNYRFRKHVAESSCACPLEQAITDGS